MENDTWNIVDYVYSTKILFTWILSFVHIRMYSYRSNHVCISMGVWQRGMPTDCGYPSIQHERNEDLLKFSQAGELDGGDGCTANTYKIEPQLAYK